MFKKHKELIILNFIILLTVPFNLYILKTLTGVLLLSDFYLIIINTLIWGIIFNLRFFRSK